MIPKTVSEKQQKITGEKFVGVFTGIEIIFQFPKKIELHGN